MKNPFRYFNSSTEIIGLTVMTYIAIRFRSAQAEDLLFERGIDICHEPVRIWWSRFGPIFAAEIPKRRVQLRCFSRWRWHLDEVFVRINGETHNHFNDDRHLNRREIFKQNRSAALAEWRQLAA